MHHVYVVSPSNACGAVWAAVDTRLSTLFAGVVTCDQPNANIHRFDGMMFLDGVSSPCPINANNIILRGAALRSTETVCRYLCGVTPGDPANEPSGVRPRCVHRIRLQTGTRRQTNADEVVKCGTACQSRYCVHPARRLRALCHRDDRVCRLDIAEQTRLVQVLSNG